MSNVADTVWAQSCSMQWIEQFRTIYQVFRGNPFNTGQWDVIRAGVSECLHVVAGPGTGKTTSMVGRILKLVFHDQVQPSAILATTFTKKAAEELRSRILSQGMELKTLLLADSSVPAAAKTWIETVDMNQVLTGTLDSICQDILRESKPAGSADPEPVDAYVASTVMFRDGLLFSGNMSDADMHGHLRSFHGPHPFGYHALRKGELIEEIYQRWNNDRVDFNKFVTSGTPPEQQAKTVIQTVINRYCAKLDQLGAIDFVQLETEVLRRFQAGDPKANAWRERLKVLIVDEYQDTNLLQEQIYFEMTKSCRVMTVVGDDDQSLYRFRGATVELFVDFPTRINSALGLSATRHFLRENYRSTQPIVDLVNGYADLDADYQAVRVPPPAGGSRGIICQSTIQPVFPVLGLFRSDPDDLADDLAGLIHDVFKGSGRLIPGFGNLVSISHGGDLGDCCLLGSSHQEYAGERERLPRLLRERLESMSPSIEVFNPRGRSLSDIPQVELFGGYVAHVVDPLGSKLNASAVGKYDDDTRAVIKRWQDKAADHYSAATTPTDLKNYVQGWFDRNPGAGKSWPKRVSILEFLNGLRHYFPFFRNDPEGLLYYEVFTRQFQACQRLGSWSADILWHPYSADRQERAAFDLIEFMLGPIASGAVGVNEELIESFPRDRLSIISIHQAKGLEFPMVIVDIGSDFKVNNAQQRRNRFPENGESSHRLEDAMRPHAKGFTPMSRTEKDRAFDDLYRKYFVAYSRPEQILLLVGLDKSRPDTGILKNVASGDDRHGNRLWPANVPITYL
jgi:DNA helicase-2/ATP-dependent DNA helicase PcrA